MAPYEKLLAWRECHGLALAVYRTTKSFPAEERYGLTSQLRRAAFSAPANIVEGSSRRTAREFRRFLDIALASLSEVGYALRFTHEAGLLTDADWQPLNDQQIAPAFSPGACIRQSGSASRDLHQPPPASATLHSPAP